MIQSEQIYKDVFVYHNALKNSDEFMNLILSESAFTTGWGDWYTMGRQTLIPEYPSTVWEEFPSEQEWNSVFSSTNNPIARSVSDAFYLSTSDYVRRCNVSIQNWSHGTPTINSHYSKERDSTLAMQYHTDFIMSEAECPGYKHWITCNLYINDNYDGGGLSFKVFKNESEYDIFSYKPKAGDALVFPSHHPYYHGVKKTTSGEKFFVRLFWGYEYRGSDEWNRNKELLGDEWIESERNRADYENKSSKWMKGHVEED